MRRNIASLVAASALAWVACGSEPEAPTPSGAPMGAAPVEAETAGTNRAPVVEGLKLHPPSPAPGGKVEARFDVMDPDGDPVRVQLVWTVGGRIVERGERRQITLDRVAKGTEVRVEVSATDGSEESRLLRAWANVGNQLPEIQAIFLDPKQVYSGVVVRAVPEALDADGDPLSFEYEWSVPSRGVSERGETLDTKGLRRGDEVVLRVRASDGNGESPWITTEFALGNAPPELPGDPQFRVEQGEFRHTLQATDPDGDRSLRYRLVSGPAGMKVDAVSGLISWRPQASDAGVHPVEVSVSDSMGDSTSMRFELAVNLSDSPASAAE